MASIAEDSVVAGHLRCCSLGMTSYGAITQTQGTLMQPYGYTGREFDAETGLYYYRARTYDPETGLFMQSDPIEFAGGQFSLYSFVQGNSFNRGDPTGLILVEYVRDQPSKRADSIAATTHVGVAVIGGAARIVSQLEDLRRGDFSVRIDNRGRFRPAGTGYCSFAEHAMLQAEVARWSKTESCDYIPGGVFLKTAGDTLRAANLIKMRAFSRLALARATINARCYGGGDEGHQTALRNALIAMDWCHTSITIRGAKR